MKTLTDHISQRINNDKHFNLIVRGVNARHSASESLIDYYNPARPSLIQVFSFQELHYFNQLSRYAQWREIERLVEQQVQTLIFSDHLTAPEIFSAQTYISVATTDFSSQQLLRYFDSHFASLFYPSDIVQGGLLSIENQGILITGDSGVGKSQILLSLLDRGHLWISDELTHCYITARGEVVGQAVQELISFSHVKDIGPINMDKTFGLSKRLPCCPLAGIIHLGENNKRQNRPVPLYEQKLTKSILGQHFPLWYINPAASNLEVMIETCAKQLVLAKWGQQADTELEQEIKNALCDTV